MNIHNHGVNMELLKVENLCKTYPSFKLQDVSFSLEEGYIMGFIGRNGAGKTTTIKSMLNIISAEKGSSKICGYDIQTNEDEVKKSIGFISGTDGFYSTKKLKTISSVYKKFFPTWNQEKYESLLQKFKLDENKKIKELSAGMKIKFQLALAMSHDAKLLILDEPTSGLDPVSRDELILLFQEYVADEKHSILFSTHVISDLEKCADFITYINNGKILKSTDSVSFKQDYRLISGKNDELSDELKSKIIGLNINKFGFEGMINTSHKELFTSFNLSEPSFEEIMIHIEREYK